MHFAQATLGVFGSQQVLDLLAEAFAHLVPQRASLCEEDVPTHDTTGHLLESLNTCRGNDLEKFREMGFSMVDKRKHGRTAGQRDAVVSLFETQCGALKVRQNVSNT